MTKENPFNDESFQLCHDYVKSNDLYYKGHPSGVRSIFWYGCPECGANQARSVADDTLSFSQRCGHCGKECYIRRAEQPENSWRQPQ